MPAKWRILSELCRRSPLLPARHWTCCRPARPFCCSPAVSAVDRAPFRPRRALLLTKITRYEYERRLHPDLSESQLEALLKERGSNYNTLLHHHYMHKGCEKTLIHSLQEHGLDISVVSRFDYTASAVREADVVFTVGGDGTFLLGAAKLMTPDKPIIGINSDPTRSVGHLLLPKHYSVNIRAAVNKVMKGEFSWLLRSRIRVTLRGKDVFHAPIELHNQQLSHPECRYLDLDWQCTPSDDEGTTIDSRATTGTYVLPVLALNEVFIGECVSARVSYYEMSVDGATWFKQKSSGLCVCSGTGSTSWAFNINKLTRQKVVELIEDIAAETSLPIDTSDHQLIDNVLNRANNRLLFDADAGQMCYTIRDPIVTAVAEYNTCHHWRAMARHLAVRSRCFDASLVIDGGLSFPFNDGTLAQLEIRPEFSLRTLVMQ